MTDSGLWRTKSALSAPLVLRPRWYIRFRPAIEFLFAIAVSLRCANYALKATHHHQISALVFLLGALGVICFGIYRLSTTYRRSQMLVLDEEAVTLSGAVKSRLYIERSSRGGGIDVPDSAARSDKYDVRLMVSSLAA
jgi:hypothetical protein